MTPQHPAYVWWKGGLVPWDEATVHVTDIAWSTLGAVFEGIRGYWNDEHQQLHIFRLREHLQRLRDSTRLVRLPLDLSVEDLESIIVDLVRANECREDTYIFPLVYSGDATRRFDPADLSAEVVVKTSPQPSHLKSDFRQHARTSTWTRISDTVMPPRVKSIPNYRNGQLATHEVRQDGYDVAVMLNPQGKVSEAPGACIAHVRHGRIVTPDVTSGILESITRDALITIAREDMGLEVIERAVDRTELYLADEVFTCGTAAEITAIVSVDRYTIGDGTRGPITTALEERFEDIVRGRSGARPAWRTSVDLPVPAHT